MTLITRFPPAPVDAGEAEVFHRALARWNRRRLAVGKPTGAWRDDLVEDHEMRLAEGAWIEAFRT